MDSGRQTTDPGGTASNLHAKLIDTMLDLAGLDYDAVDVRLSLRPALIGQWTQTGIKQSFACGDVWYLLERPIGTRLYRLHLKTNLKHADRARRPTHVPGPFRAGAVGKLEPWPGSGAVVRPAQRTGAVQHELPANPGEWIWTWG